MQTPVKICLLLQLVASVVVSGASDCEDLPCSHKCVVVAGLAKCTCPEEMSLGEDQKTCKAPVSILLAMFRGIKQLTEKPKDNDIEPVITVATTAFDINFATKELYASANNSILRYSLKAKNEPPQNVVTLDSSATSIAVDWVRNDLYWVSEQRSTIEASSHQGGNHRTVLTFEDAKTQALPGDPKPIMADWNYLQIDPYVEKMVWVGGGLVYSADLKGQNLQIGVGGWRGVSAVTLDTKSQLVYVIGTRIDKSQYIGRSRYDGSHAEEVAKVPHPGSTVYSCAVLGRSVYWQTSHNAESIYKAEIPASGTGGQARITLVEELNQIVRAMKILHPDVQKTVK